MRRRLWGLRNLWEMWSQLKSRKSKGREIKQLRLRLEPLEKRELLTVQFWTGASGTDANWNNPANWLSNTVPITNDDLVFANIVNGNTVTNKLTNDNISGVVFDSITFAGSGFVIAGSQPISLNAS